MKSALISYFKEKRCQEKCNIGKNFVTLSDKQIVHGNDFLDEMAVFVGCEAVCGNFWVFFTKGVVNQYKIRLNEPNLFRDMKRDYENAKDEDMKNHSSQ